MRLYSFVAAAAALLTASLAAHADTLTENFTVTGNTGAQTNGGLYGIASTTFSQFNPSLGTLNSITITFSGNATNPGSVLDQLDQVAPTNSAVNFSGRANGSNYGGGSFLISYSAAEPTDYLTALFTGTGTEGLNLLFNAPTTKVAVNNGTLTYGYTAPTPVAATPEPSSLALLGAGLLGAVGVARKRFV